jgi:hypothetical protein
MRNSSQIVQGIFLYEKFNIFSSSGDGGETHTLLGSKERANLNRQNSLELYEKFNSFSSSGDGGETHTLLGSKERANLNRQNSLEPTVFFLL